MLSDLNFLRIGDAVGLHELLLGDLEFLGDLPGVVPLHDGVVGGGAACNGSRCGIRCYRGGSGGLVLPARHRRGNGTRQFAGALGDLARTRCNARCGLRDELFRHLEDLTDLQDGIASEAIHPLEIGNGHPERGGDSGHRVAGTHDIGFGTRCRGWRGIGRGDGGGWFGGRLRGCLGSPGRGNPYSRSFLKGSLGACQQSLAVPLGLGRLRALRICRRGWLRRLRSLCNLGHQRGLSACGRLLTRSTARGWFLIALGFLGRPGRVRWCGFRRFDRRGLAGLHRVEGIESPDGDHMEKQHHQKGVRQLHVRLGTVVFVFLRGVHGCRACAEPTGAFRGHRVHGMCWLAVVVRSDGRIGITVGRGEPSPGSGTPPLGGCSHGTCRTRRFPVKRGRCFRGLPWRRRR